MTRLGILMLAAVTAAGAQTPAPLQLHELHDSAARQDPRARQADLLRAQSNLRLSNLSAERLPQLSLEGTAQYQSDVPGIPLPGARRPPHDTYDAHVGATQRVFDPTARARRAVEIAGAARADAARAARLYGMRQQVNEAFFAALRAQEQEDEFGAAITALEAQLALATNRVREGAALPSEQSLIGAELLSRRQLRIDAASARVAALAVLANLTGMTLDSARRLQLPDLAGSIAEARTRGDALRARPEFIELARSRELLERQQAARGSQDLPRVLAFGRAGYGRPGLNPLNDRFDTFWLAGVQLQWAPWNWGASHRDRELLAVQRRIVDTEEQALAQSIARTSTNDLAEIDRLAAALALDEEIIALRAQVAEEARIRFGESAVTAAELVQRRTELLSARITRAVHRVTLAQACARYLTTLGLEAR